MEGQVKKVSQLQIIVLRWQLEMALIILCTFGLLLFVGTALLTKKTFNNFEEAQTRIIVENLRQELLLGQYPAIVRKCKNLAEFEYINAILVSTSEGIVICSEGHLLNNAHAEQQRVFFDEEKQQLAAYVKVQFNNYFLPEFLSLASIAICFGAVVFGFAMRRYSRLLTRDVLQPLSSVKDILRDAQTHRAQFSNYFEECKTKASEIEEIRTIQRVVIDFITVQKEQEILKLSARTNSAIAQTTQALAHDVRKPFTMLKSIINAVNSAPNSKNAAEIIQLSLPEVTQAIVSVEGMIQDVLQIGSDAKPLLEATAPEALIEQAISNLLRIYPDAKLKIAYSLKHTQMVSVDALRVERVFSNILGNAVQAMNGEGEIWFHTEDKGKLIEVTIGNGGSFIPAESIPMLFDAFYTSGKKGGTGLGLAIAKKIIESHGGTIHCASFESEVRTLGAVEFSFTLPCAYTAVNWQGNPLPTSTLKLNQQNKEPNPATLKVEFFEGSHEDSGVTENLLAGAHAEEAHNQLPIATIIKPAFAYIDDSLAYLIGMRMKVKSEATLYEFRSTNSFLEKVQNEPEFLASLCFIVTDYHFAANDNYNGCSFATELRNLGYEKPVLLASDASFSTEELLTFGITAAVPKVVSSWRDLAHWAELGAVGRE